MEKRKNIWRFIVSLLVILGMFLFGATGTLAAAPQGKLTMAIHWPVSANWFDPLRANPGTLGWFTLSMWNDALVKPMPDGTYTPCLAESFSNNENYTVYEFKLRKGVKFHNGEDFDAKLFSAEPTS